MQDDERARRVIAMVDDLMFGAGVCTPPPAAEAAPPSKPHPLQKMKIGDVWSPGPTAEVVIAAGHPMAGAVRATMVVPASMEQWTYDILADEAARRLPSRRSIARTPRPCLRFSVVRRIRPRTHARARRRTRTASRASPSASGSDGPSDPPGKHSHALAARS